MGFSPLLDQDISVCGHSLFGVGLASLGVNNIGDYLYHKIGEQYIVARFIKLLERKYEGGVVLSSIPSNDDVFKKDYLADISIGDLDESEKQRAPLLVFFSSRDGFRNQYNTLSIPLIALYGCNMPGWSLKTTSHEASHIFVDGMCDYLFRRIKDKRWWEEQSMRCRAKSLDTCKTTIEDAIWQYFVTGIIDILVAEYGVVDLKFDAYDDFLGKYYDEMKEIMTHAFDFLYFYNSDLVSYIEGIWLTWSVLPNVSDKIPVYVLRSLCIVALKNIEQPHIEDNAIDIFRKIIQNLERNRSEGFSKEQLKKALDYIDRNKHDIKHFEGIIFNLLRRRFLVQCVKTFFFSQSISAEIANENIPITDSKRKEIKKSNAPQIPFSNPLKLTELSAVELNLSEAKSYKIYYDLAFNYVRD
jgi:hypothetical protein